MLGDGSLKVPGNDKVYLDDFKVAYNVRLIFIYITSWLFLLTLF